MRYCLYVDIDRAGRIDCELYQRARWIQGPSEDVAKNHNTSLELISGTSWPYAAGGCVYLNKR
jgi:hypothetical protein